ncbi:MULTISPECIES: sulfurtransferase TusA family protein [Prochlorococcus]|uniref:sulfurtransferase TusA family protein n=1 Tax=Prochlorococcus TaxID=1218 RepID=UPI000533B2AA|nr:MULTISPECIES: sulfurtransferase TusA family protein [Prochlorococcus]KGG13374.1 hypothetical protein EV05_1054 [Prochlorococcus sp. MIT 0601]
MSKKYSLNFEYLDLRGVPCPVNYIRSSLAAEKITPNHFLKIDLDKGEPEKMVLSGLREAGFHVKIISDTSSWLTLKVSQGDCSD